MKIQQLSADEAIASLHSAPQGLSLAEAERRLRELGPNRVPEVAQEPPWLRLLKEFVHFFSLILWVAAGLAFVAEWSAPGQGMAKIGYAIVAVILPTCFWGRSRPLPPWRRSLTPIEEIAPCAHVDASPSDLWLTILHHPDRRIVDPHAKARAAAAMILLDDNFASIVDRPTTVRTGSTRRVCVGTARAARCADARTRAEGTVDEVRWHRKRSTADRRWLPLHCL